jgi:MFS family permease
MQTTAQGYLIYELTHSPIFLGYVGFATGIPALLFTLYGGVIADRFPRRSVLIATQIAMMILAVILATLTFLHIIQPWHIIVLAFFLGVTNAFDSPARMAFVLEMVERKDLVNAIALNATMFNSASAVGPAIAGVVYAIFGPAWCFTINGVSFIGVIIALKLMKLKKMEIAPSQQSVFKELKEGIVYVVKEQKMILTLIVIISMTGFFGIAFATIFPAWAVNIMHGNAATNGLLQSARGAGALTGALFIATVSHLKIKGKLLTFGMFAFPIFLMVFLFLRQLPLTLVLLYFIGISSLMVLNMANGFVQTLVSDKLRGRVMALYSLAFFGSMTLGALFIGAVAEHFSEPIAVAVNATILFVTALVIWIFIPKLRALK